MDLKLYDPQAMGETEEAAAALRALKLECDEARRSGQTGHIPAPVVGRLPEHASRLAMILAVLSQPEEEVPAVHAAHVAAGEAIARESARTLGDSIAAHQRAARDDYAGQVEIVIQALRRLGGQATQRELLRSCRSLRSKDVAEIAQRLAAEGEVVIQQEKTGGGQRAVLRLIKGA